MSAVATAIVGSSIVGAVVSNNASKRASKSASKSEAANLAFEQEKYDDWKEMYGGIEENLSEYYGGLTSEYYESLGLESFQQEYETSMTRMRETLAQRGIQDSGLSASLELQGQLSAAESKATIRRDAPSMAAEEKRGFLQVGLGQNPGQGLSSVMQNQASGARSRANAAEQAAGEAVGNAVSTAGTAAADYFRANPVGKSNPNIGLK